MKPVKQRNSEDIALEIEKELKQEMERQVNWILEHLDEYHNERDIIETLTDGLEIFDSLLLAYDVAKEREARQEFKTGEDAYREATGGY